MAYTVEQYEALQDAISQGVTTVKYSDKEVTYRSLNDMLRILALMKKELYPSSVGTGRVKVEYNKGVYPDSETCE